MIIVLGSVTLLPDKIAEALSASQAHVLRSRLEQGCLAHAASVDSENPDRLVFVERWVDWAALRTHFGVPASRHFVQALGAMAVGPPSMLIYEATEINMAGQPVDPARQP